jgi:hypothetical protein
MMHRRLAARLALAALGSSLANPASACSVCGCGDPLLSSTDPAAITGQLRFQVDTEYLRIDAGTDGAPGFTDKLTQWSYRFNAVYRPLEVLSLIATLPLGNRMIHTVGGGEDVINSNLTGVGDAEVAARWAAWRSVDFGTGRVHEMAIAAGTAIPTGRHNAKSADGTLVDPHGQLGTGGWGPFAGLHYRYEQGSWNGFASLTYRRRTQASYFDGSRYKFGDAVLWSFHGQRRPIQRVALDLGVDGRYARADKATEPDGTVTSAVDNTGGTVLSVAPGVYFNAARDLWLFVRGQVPFYTNLFGEQDVRPSVTIGLQYQAF